MPSWGKTAFLLETLLENHGAWTEKLLDCILSFCIRSHCWQHEHSWGRDYTGITLSKSRAANKLIRWFYFLLELIYTSGLHQFLWHQFPRFCMHNAPLFQNPHANVTRHSYVVWETVEGGSPFLPCPSFLILQTQAAFLLRIFSQGKDGKSIDLGTLVVIF